MFNSGKSVSELITELKSEVDIAPEIPKSTYLTWLNSIEQLCYSEIIKEQREIIVENPTTSVSLADLTISNDESPIRFEDIYAVYADGVQLMKTTLASGQTEVLFISVISNCVGSSLFPAPIELITGTLFSYAALIIASLPLTVSIASAT